MAKYLNRVRMSVSGAAGTGTLTLSAQAVGFQAFDVGGLVDGDQTPYLIEDGNPVGSQWEIGVGTWHSNQTFVRDTVTASSAGGTSKISTTTNAIISAIFRAEDLTRITSSPAVVQHGTYQGTTNPPTITLGATPTPGNLLVAIGNGGGGVVSTVYGAGFFQSWTDKKGTFDQSTQYGCNYGLRTVRSGDGTSWVMGTINAGGPTLNAVLVEVSGVDVTKLSELLMRNGTFGTSDTILDALSVPNALTLSFAGGDPNTITVTSPTPAALHNNVNGSSMAFAYDTSTAGFDGMTARIASGTLGGFIMTLPGA